MLPVNEEPERLHRSLQLLIVGAIIKDKDKITHLKVADVGFQWQFKGAPIAFLFGNLISLRGFGLLLASGKHPVAGPLGIGLHQYVGCIEFYGNIKHPLEKRQEFELHQQPVGGDHLLSRSPFGIGKTYLMCRQAKLRTYLDIEDSIDLKRTAGSRLSSPGDPFFVLVVTDDL